MAVYSNKNIFINILWLTNKPEVEEKKVRGLCLNRLNCMSDRIQVSKIIVSGSISMSLVI